MKNGDVKMSFGSRIIKLRKENNITRGKLAKDLNISYITLRNYEICGIEPEYKLLIKIAKYFNVTVDYMLGLQSYSNMQKQKHLKKINLDNKQESSEADKINLEDKVKSIEDILIEMFKEFGYLDSKDDITDDDLTFFKSLGLMINSYFSMKKR